MAGWRDWLPMWLRGDSSGSTGAGPSLGPLAERKPLPASGPVPVFWMLGKTGSGKTSIVRFLTGATSAEIGNGYRPCTRSTLEYSFPGPEEQLLRFLDTRGLGETGYDPEAEIAALSQQSHVVIATVRVADVACGDLVRTLAELRKASPDRPVVLVLTCLHELLGPAEVHPHPDPFPLVPPWPLELPENLRRGIVDQERRFAGLYDRIVPIDFTRPEDGYPDPEYGDERLQQTLAELLPRAYRQVVVGLSDLRHSLGPAARKQALPIILQYAGWSAAAAAVPIPWVDLPVVVGLQSRMVSLLAAVYQQPMQSSLMWKIAAAVGPRVATSAAVRGLAKLIPGVGSAINASVTFAYTYTLGEMCCWYFDRLQRGLVPTEEELQKHWAGHYERVLKQLTGRS